MTLEGSSAAIEDKGTEKEKEPSFNKKEKLSSSVNHSLVLGLCFLLFLVVCKLYLEQYIEIRRLEEQKVSIEIQLKKEEEELEHMKKRVAFLGTLEGIEKIARERLKYIKEEEVIVVPIESKRGSSEG